jgi:hypothetical protein
LSWVLNVYGTVFAALCSALIAGHAGKFGGRYGQRLVAIPGSLIFALGVLILMHLGSQPDYLVGWLPANILIGLGVGLTMHSPSSASATALPPARFGIGSAVNATARQFGAVIGVAILFAILGAPGNDDLVLTYDRAVVNSMSDLYHEDVPLEYIQQVFEVMGRARHHTFQILTKRHERLAELSTLLPWAPNIWQGVSVENNRWAVRADSLRTVPAAIRFLSCEPLLGSLDKLDLSGIDWVISGGESGPRHHPFKLEWARDLRDRAKAQGLLFFWKQNGGIHTPKLTPR